jgi:chromosome segregation ATPase
VSGLREKIADLVDAISRNEVSEPTDAVLRVLAEHGDTQQVRELQAANDRLGDALTRQIKVADDALAGRDASVEVLNGARAALASAEMSIDRVRAEREQLREEKVTAEAGLAAARQQLDQVRASRDLARDDVLESLAVAERRAEVAEQRLAAVRDVAEEFSDSPTPWPHVADRILDALDAPARPAGHDETGQ